jgi:hypothetical protein
MPVKTKSSSDIMGGDKHNCNDDLKKINDPITLSPSPKSAKTTRRRRIKVRAKGVTMDGDGGGSVLDSFSFPQSFHESFHVVGSLQSPTTPTSTKSPTSAPTRRKKKIVLRKLPSRPPLVSDMNHDGTPRKAKSTRDLLREYDDM